MTADTDWNASEFMVAVKLDETMSFASKVVKCVVCPPSAVNKRAVVGVISCLLYTSDAADE